MGRALAAAVCALLLTSGVAIAASQIDGYKRARIAECLNPPAVQLLLMEIDARLRTVGAAPPAWQTLRAETAGDWETLRDAGTIGAFDMIVTCDGEYLDGLADRKMAGEKKAVWRERIILAGPPDAAAEMEGLDAAVIMKAVFASRRLFFSLLTDKHVLGAEADLWKKAGVASPGDNTNYVETDRDALSALMQTAEEGGFVLTGAASFAQYLSSESDDAALVKLADTDAWITGWAVRTATFGFRKARAADAEKFMEWLTGPGREVIAGFSLGGERPFEPIK
jgi:hypothetical protein